MTGFGFGGSVGGRPPPGNARSVAGFNRYRFPLMSTSVRLTSNAFPFAGLTPRKLSERVVANRSPGFTSNIWKYGPAYSEFFRSIPVTTMGSSKDDEEMTTGPWIRRTRSIPPSFCKMPPVPQPADPCHAIYSSGFFLRITRHQYG